MRVEEDAGGILDVPRLAPQSSARDERLRCRVRQATRIKGVDQVASVGGLPVCDLERVRLVGARELGD
jgi:hypothetical protein